MEILNQTPFAMMGLPGYDKDGRETVSLVVKGTFALCRDRLPEALSAEEQEPIALADEHWGEPGRSPVRYESDLAPWKPGTDCLLLGCARDPRGRPTRRQRVSFRVGNLCKEAWVTSEEEMDGIPLHFLERMRWSGPRLLRSRKPADGFGFYPRQLTPRVGFAGTYNDEWRQERAPFLPTDFDYRFFQCAFPGLVSTSFLRGDEVVLAEGVSSEGRISTLLPKTAIEVELVTRGRRTRERAELDTVLLRADEGRLVLVWRRMFLTGAPPSDVHGFRVASIGLGAS